MSLPVNTKQELIYLLQKNKEKIMSYGVKSLGIFGSFVRDEAIVTSDIDFYIDFFPEKKNYDNFIDLSFYLKDLLGRDVEIITPQSLSKYIGPHILKEVEYVSIAA